MVIVAWRAAACARQRADALLPAFRRLQRHFHSQQSVADALREAREQLKQAALPSVAPRDAKALVANALQPRFANSSDVFFHSDRKLTEAEAAALASAVAQRAEGQPLAYVLGRKEFWSMEFAVTRDTLVPRSDSEVLIETLTEQFPRQMPLHILDIGTGSGCLLLSALSEFPLASGVGIDISAGALAIAKQNAHTNNLEQRAQFLCQDLRELPQLDAQNETLFQRFDVILCNPPYIPSQELHLVAPDVLKYEPHLALFSDGGPNVDADESEANADPEGLRMYRLLHESITKLLRPEGSTSELSRKRCVVLEIGSEQQARAVRVLFTESRTKAAGRSSVLRFERFLFDASGKYRGLLIVTP